MVLTPLPTQQSGIPPPSSVLASLGRQVHPNQLRLRLPRKGPAVLSINGIRCFTPREKCGAQTYRRHEKSIVKRSVTQRGSAEKVPGCRHLMQEARTQPPALKYLAAERSEDGASERYTTPWCSEWCQNHCSNHSGFLTGADTFVWTTLLAMAPVSHAISERLSFGYFSLARQRKVTAAPRRGDANRPTRSQVLHANREQTTKQTKPKPQSFPRSTSAPPRGSLPPPVCFSSHARRSSRGVTPNLSR